MSWFTALLGAVVGGIIGFFVGGPSGAFMGASIGFSLGMAIDPIAPDVKSPGMAVEPLQITSNIIGTPIIDLLGTSRITGLLLAFGLERTVPVYVKVKQGKKTVKQLKGYYYYASWQVGICFGPTDTLYTVFRNDDEVIWEGALPRPVSGGVETILPTGVGTAGVVRFYFGTDDQPADATVATLIGDATLNSPLRGLCYAVFDNCYLGTYNRMPTMSFVVRRTPAIAFSTKHVIQTYDYNPMHAIWYMLTTLGGLPTTWLNTLDFAAVALVLDGERRGITALLNDQRSLETYIETVNSHIDGILRYGSDGAFHPKLIRNDYVPANLEVIDETVLLDKPEFSRGSWIGTVNEVKAKFSLITRPFIIPNFLFTAEISGGAAADIVKRVFLDLSETIRASMGNTPAGGILFYADIKYLVGSSAPPTWNVTIPSVSDNRLRAILELDPAGNALYVAIGVFDGTDIGDDHWVLHKRSLTDGSVVWQYVHDTFYYSGAHEITGLSYYGGNIYIIGLTDGGTSRSSWAIEKRTEDNVSVWLKLAGTPAPVYNSDGGAVCADSSGVYCAIFSGIANNWVVQKRALSDGAIVWEKIQAYGTIFPHKIILFGDYVYVMGGTGSWIIEKRRKSDGVRLYYRSWAPAGGSNAILNSFSINPDCPYNLQNYIRVCGYDAGGGGGAYRVRIERLLESDFSTNADVETATKSFASGIDVDEGGGIYDSVICAVPTNNAGTGKKDIMIQRRKALTLGY